RAVTVAIVHQRVHIPPVHFVRPVAEQVRPGRIDEGAAALEIDAVDPLVGRFENTGEALRVRLRFGRAAPGPRWAQQHHLYGAGGQLELLGAYLDVEHGAVLAADLHRAAPEATFDEAAVLRLPPRLLAHRHVAAAQVQELFAAIAEQGA